MEMAQLNDIFFVVFFSSFNFQDIWLVIKKILCLNKGTDLN